MVDIEKAEDFPLRALLNEELGGFNTFEDLIDFLRELQEPFLIVDLQGKVLYSSRYMRELLVEMGFQEPPDNKQIQEYFDAEEPILKLLNAKLREGKARSRITTKVKVPASEEPKELSWIVMYPKRGSTYLLILSNDALLTIDSFRQNIINNLSHELRTPLTILKGILEYLLNPVTSNISREELEEHLKVMLEKTVDLEGLIHELLEVARLERGRFQIKKYWFPIKPLLERLVMRYSGRARKFKMRLSYEINLLKEAELLGDPARINYLVSELLDNAIKFSNEGAEITFKAYSQGDDLVIEVTDEGIGIPEMYIDRIFHPFFKGDNRPNRKTYGVGLGLFIVKQIVDGHDGEIQVLSDLGKGTTFKVRLPNLRVKSTKSSETSRDEFSS